MEYTVVVGCIEVQEREQAQVYIVVVQEQVQELDMAVELVQGMAEEQAQVFAKKKR